MLISCFKKRYLARYYFEHAVIYFGILTFAKEIEFTTPKIQASASSGTLVCWFLLRQLGWLIFDHFQGATERK